VPNSIHFTIQYNTIQIYLTGAIVQSTESCDRLQRRRGDLYEIKDCEGENFRLEVVRLIEIVEIVRISDILFCSLWINLCDCYIIA